MSLKHESEKIELDTKKLLEKHRRADYSSVEGTTWNAQIAPGRQRHWTRPEHEKRPSLLNSTPDGKTHLRNIRESENE